MCHDRVGAPVLVVAMAAGCLRASRKAFFEKKVRGGSELNAQGERERSGIEGEGGTFVWRDGGCVGRGRWARRGADGGGEEVHLAADSLEERVSLVNLKEGIIFTN